MYLRNNTALFGDDNSTMGEKCFFLDRSHHYEGFLYTESLVTAVFSLVCAVIATSANALIIITIWKSSQLHLPSYVLLACLAVADFMTGLIVQPTYFMHKIASFLGNEDLNCGSRVVMECVAWISAAVSCMCYASISGERYLALHFHLKYSQIMTTRRLLYFIALYWVCTAAMSLSRFALTNQKPFIIVNIVGISNSTLMVLLAYWKIYWLVRYHHLKIRDQARATGGDGELDMKKFRKSIGYLAFLVGVFVVLYVPFTCALIAFASLGFTPEVEAAYDITRTLVFTASTINPFLYFWKMKELREAVFDVLNIRNRSQGTLNVTFHVNKSLSNETHLLRGTSGSSVPIDSK